MTDPFIDDRKVEIELGTLRKLYALLYSTSSYATSLVDDVADVMQKLNSTFEALQNEGKSSDRIDGDGEES